MEGNKKKRDTSESVIQTSVYEKKKKDFNLQIIVLFLRQKL